MAERHRTQIVALKERHIEEKVDDAPATLRIERVRECIEIRHAIVPQDDDFTVKPPDQRMYA
jgi:hypothetical protein